MKLANQNQHAQAIQNRASPKSSKGMQFQLKKSPKQTVGDESAGMSNRRRTLASRHSGNASDALCLNDLENVG